LWTAFFFGLLTMYLLLNWLPTLLIGSGLARPDAALVQMSFNLFGAMAAFVTGYLMDRLSLSKVVVVVFLASALAIGVLANVPPQLLLAALMGGFVGIAMSSNQALLYAIAPTNYPTEVRGTGVGSAVTVGRLGSAAGPLLGAALLASGRSPKEVLLVLVPTILAAGAAALMLAALMRRQIKDTPSA
jgi:AAHS family 3-hydroxyphenylpropionic acid transporter